MASHLRRLRVARRSVSDTLVLVLARLLRSSMATQRLHLARKFCARCVRGALVFALPPLLACCIDAQPMHLARKSRVRIIRRLLTAQLFHLASEPRELFLDCFRARRGA